MAGATVLANLSASDITVGKARTRTLLCLSQSARCVAAYLYAAAGEGESTTDLAWDGQTAIFENGALLAKSDRFPAGPRAVVADVDLTLLRHERLQMGTFADCAAMTGAQDRAWRSISFELAPPATDLGLLRPSPVFPLCQQTPQSWNRIVLRPLPFRSRLSNNALKAARLRAWLLAYQAGWTPHMRCWWPYAQRMNWGGPEQLFGVTPCPVLAPRGRHWPAPTP